MFRSCDAQKKQRGGGTQGRGKHIVKTPPPKTVLDTPTYDTIPPPFVLRPVVFLRGNGHRPESHLLSPPKLVLEGALYSTFPPPIHRTIRLPPPPNLTFSQRICPPPSLILGCATESLVAVWQMKLARTPEPFCAP